MAMSNAEIIDREKMELFKQGILKPTGRMIQAADGEGNPIMIPEIEQIHTFNGWKDLGYKVKKGEHSRIRFAIWKFSSKEVEKENGEKENKTAMFLKEACWFTREQVELMKGVTA